MVNCRAEYLREERDLVQGLLAMGGRDGIQGRDRDGKSGLHGYVVHCAMAYALRLTRVTE